MTGNMVYYKNIKEKENYEKSRIRFFSIGAINASLDAKKIKLFGLEIPLRKLCATLIKQASNKNPEVIGIEIHSIEFNYIYKPET